GSLGLDLESTTDITLIDSRPVKIPTGVRGPMLINGQPQGALLLGRSSSGLKALFVLPGVIDRDYCGEISIVAQTSFPPPLHIVKGSRIAQLVPVPQLTACMKTLSPRDRRTGGFGSTGGMALLTGPVHEKPVVTAVLIHGQEQLTLQVLLDTGADLSIVS
ncbi:POK9 protein, partial [Serilophus lunatus]|nr:POK9 protein [Serilophus lunatus]